MIEVELPDGTIVEFPEGTSHDTIKSVLSGRGWEKPLPPDNQSFAMTAGLSELSAMSSNPQVAQPVEDVGAFGAFAANLAPGMTFGFADNIAAGIGSVFEDRSYDEILKGLRAQDAKIAEQHPIASTAGQIAGAVMPSAAGYKLAERGLKAAMPALNPATLPARAGLGAATGVAEGATYGAGTADGGDMAESMKNNAIIGGLGGLAAPVAMAAAAVPFKAVGNAVSSAFNIPSDVRAGAAIEKMLRRAKMTPEDAKIAIQQAADEGQDVFKLVDALGLSGQRGLSGIARQPGDTARQEIADFLMTRQAGQGDRLSSFIAAALSAPDTAAARTAALKEARGAAADVAYKAARDGAGPVDVRDVLSVIDDRIGPMLGSGVADDGISGKLIKYRGRLAAKNPAASVIKGATAPAAGDTTKTAVELADFDRILLLKQEIGDDIGAAVRAGRNNEARELKKVSDALDAALEASSAGYRGANDEFAKASKAIGAVDTGKASASPRVRSEDTAATWAKMSPEEQAAFRAGYADPVIAKIDASAFGVDKSRPLTGTKTAKDLEFLAADPDLIKRQIGRESTMFETKNAALGGSKTADNMADAADTATTSASVIRNLLTGNWGSAGGQLADRFMSAATGLNPSTREIIARALMSSDPAAAISASRKKAAQMEGPRKIIEALIRAGAVRVQ